MWFSIGGPTAVGKTSFAFQAAQELIDSQVVSAVDLVSADSRQIYQGLETISGVDVPHDFQAEQFQNQPTYISKSGLIRLWGVSVLNPDQEWSVAHFQQFALPIIERAERTSRLVIIVGGTGLYQQQILQTDPVLHISPNQEVRDQAEFLSLTELQKWLVDVDDPKWQKMNTSDQANPRRLVRAIEVALAKQQAAVSETASNDFSPSSELVSVSPSLGTLCLTDELEAIEHRIGVRVAERLEAGALLEVERLLSRYSNQKLPLFSATGVKALMALSRGEIDQETARDLWIKQEKQYAKRQLTWFKKQPNISWIEVHKDGWSARALEIIQTWLDRK